MNKINFSEEEMEKLKALCKSPAAQIIDELRDLEQRQKRGSRLSLALAIIGTVASVVAAVTGIIVLLQG